MPNTAAANVPVNKLSPYARAEHTLMGMADADFGRQERKITMVGAAATSSVRLLQSLIVLGREK